MRACTAGLLMIAALAAPAAELRNADAFFSLNMGELKAEAAEARSAGRKGLLVMFEQQGCPGCAHMRRNVLPRPDVQDFFRQNFVNLSLDIYSSVPVKDFAGRDLTEKGYAQSIRIKATPTFVFYDLTGAEIARYVGPLETPEEFMLLGRFVASGAYKTQKFAQYRSQAPSSPDPLPRGEGKFNVQTR
jgi:thioredoxin-related protein